MSVEFFQIPQKSDRSELPIGLFYLIVEKYGKILKRLLI